MRESGRIGDRTPTNFGGSGVIGDKTKFIGTDGGGLAFLPLFYFGPAR